MSRRLTLAQAIVLPKAMTGVDWNMGKDFMTLEDDFTNFPSSSECYCDHQLVGATSELESDCSMPCKGNASQICGNGNRLSLYTTGQNNYIPPAGPGFVAGGI